MKSIKSFFLYVWQWRKRLFFNKLNRKLEKVVEKKTNQRLLLQYDIIKLMIKYAKWDKDQKSKYIPLDIKTKEEIRFQVDLKYGQKMKDLNVRLNNKLQVV